MKLEDIKSYKERIYSDKIRKKYHESRFVFLRNSIKKYNISTKYVVEIGCGDAKSLEYIPQKPELYIGIDANWEGLLNLAVQKYSRDKSTYFINAHHPSYYEYAKAQIDFSLAIILETFEHLDNDQFYEYIKFLKKNVNGYIITTFPVELGPLFLLKFLVKRFFYKDDFETKFYNFKEIFGATFFLNSWVERLITSHKGFDYRKCIKALKENFKFIEVFGIPYNVRPLFLNPTIGVVAQNYLRENKCN